LSNPFDLGGKTAIVTGASTGIGQGIAIALAQAGARIAGVARSAMDATQRTIEQGGGAFHPVAADLSSIEPVERIIEETVAWSGRLDILVNNAGTFRRTDPLEFTERDWDDVINLNLKSYFFLAQAFARRVFAQGGGGKIVNIASVLSFQGGIRIPSYTASKHGVAGITRLLANEWAAKGINVNAIAPGYCITNITQAIRDDPDRSAAILARIPAGRWGMPADMGGAAVFLSSAASDYCHGTILVVDGGWLAR
jgi:2-dehydro-3-deoxy-D-gluconate 5-dehydrogenase